MTYTTTKLGGTRTATLRRNGEGPEERPEERPEEGVEEGPEERFLQRAMSIRMMGLRSLESPQNLAERVGFEPTVEFPLHTLSKRAP